jgi:hypothetical protein
MNETAVDDINGLVTEETELDDFAGSFDTLNLINEDVAIGNMNGDALYGAYSGLATVVCEGEDNVTGEFGVVISAGKVKIYAIEHRLNGFNSLSSPSGIRTIDSFDFFSGELTDSNSAVLHQYTEADMPEYNMSMEYTDSSEFQMTLSSSDGSCTATADMVRVLGANSDDPTCSSVDVSVANIPFRSIIIGSSNSENLLNKDNGTVSIVQDGCNVTLTEGNDTFTGFVDTQAERILLIGTYTEDNEENIETITMDYNVTHLYPEFEGEVMGVVKNLNSNEPAEWSIEEVDIYFPVD